MILETTLLVTGLLLLFHIYRSVVWGHDFLGDLSRNILLLLQGERVRNWWQKKSVLTMHPSLHGVESRRFAASLGERDLTDWVGRPALNKEAAASIPNRVGNPGGGTTETVVKATEMEMPVWVSADSSSYESY